MPPPNATAPQILSKSPVLLQVPHCPKSYNFSKSCCFISNATASAKVSGCSIFFCPRSVSPQLLHRPVPPVFPQIPVPAYQSGLEATPILLSTNLGRKSQNQKGKHTQLLQTLLQQPPVAASSAFPEQYLILPQNHISWKASQNLLPGQLAGSRATHHCLHCCPLYSPLCCHGLTGRAEAM